MRPLLLASAAGTHQSITHRLAQITGDRPGPQTKAFHRILHREAATVDSAILLDEFGLSTDLLIPLQETIKRLQRGTAEEIEEKGVRDL